MLEETGSHSTANMASTGRLAAMAGLDVSLQSVKAHRLKAKNLNSEIANLHTRLAKEDAA